MKLRYCGKEWDICEVEMGKFFMKYSNEFFVDFGIFVIG